MYKLVARHIEDFFQRDPNWQAVCKFLEVYGCCIDFSKRLALRRLPNCSFSHRKEYRIHRIHLDKIQLDWKEEKYYLIVTCMHFVGRLSNP